MTNLKFVPDDIVFTIPPENTMLGKGLNEVMTISEIKIKVHYHNSRSLGIIISRIDHISPDSFFFAAILSPPLSSNKCYDLFEI